MADKGKLINLFEMAERILMNAMDEETRQSIYELCKYQLEAYKSFRVLGCCPREALRQTSAQIEAVIRAGNN